MTTLMSPAERLTASKDRVTHMRDSITWMATELAMMKMAKTMGVRSSPHSGSKENATLSKGAVMKNTYSGLIPAQ